MIQPKKPAPPPERKIHPPEPRPPSSQDELTAEETFKRAADRMLPGWDQDEK